jgi:hypothetical protein
MATPVCRPQCSCPSFYFGSVPVPGSGLGVESHREQIAQRSSVATATVYYYVGTPGHYFLPLEVDGSPHRACPCLFSLPYARSWSGIRAPDRKSAPFPFVFCALALPHAASVICTTCTVYSTVHAARSHTAAHLRGGGGGGGGCQYYSIVPRVIPARLLVEAGAGSTCSGL